MCVLGCRGPLGMMLLAPCADMLNMRARLARGNGVRRDMQGLGLSASRATKELAHGGRQSSLDSVVLPRSAASPARLSPHVHRASNDTRTNDARTSPSPVLHAAPAQLGQRGSVCDGNAMGTDGELHSSVHHDALVRGQGEDKHARNINVLLAHPVVVRAMQNPRLDGILTRLLGLRPSSVLCCLLSLHLRASTRQPLVLLNAPDTGDAVPCEGGADAHARGHPDADAQGHAPAQWYPPAFAHAY